MKHFKSVLIFILLFTSLVGGDRIAIATKVIGNVQYIRGDGSGRSLKKGHIFESGDILKTDKGGFVALLFIDDKTALKVKENSEIIIAGKRSAQAIAKEINLNGGTIRAQVRKQKKGDFVVRTSVSVASVKGTDFWLVSNKAGDSLIGLEGIVSFSNLISGESIDISTGNSGISTLEGSVKSFITDPKTIPDDPSDAGSGTQKLEIEFMDASGKKKTLIIEYN